MLSVNPKPRCSICLEDFEENADVVKESSFTFEGTVINAEDLTLIETKCLHVFHRGCLYNWIQQSKDKTTPPLCPLCNAKLIEQPAVIPTENEDTPFVVITIAIPIELVILSLLIQNAYEEEAQDEADAVLQVRVPINFPNLDSSRRPPSGN